MTSIFEREEFGVDPEGIELTRPSHNTLLKRLKWLKCPASANVEDKIYCFDKFWLSAGDINQIDLINFESSIENKMKKYDSNISHVGSFPFRSTLFYAISSIDELKLRKSIYVDSPLLGGYVAYVPDTPEIEVDKRYRDNREILKEKLHLLGFNGEIFWGIPKDVAEHPNIIYFGENDSFLYASDVCQGKRDTHSLFFDYIDLFTTPPNTRNGDEKIEFVSVDYYHYPKEEQILYKFKLDDITILFEEFKVLGGEVETLSSFEVPATELVIVPRIPYAIVFHNRCKR